MSRKWSRSSFPFQEDVLQYSFFYRYGMEQLWRFTRMLFTTSFFNSSSSFCISFHTSKHNYLDIILIEMGVVDIIRSFLGPLRLRSISKPHLLEENQTIKRVDWWSSWFYFLHQWNDFLLHFLFRSWMHNNFKSSHNH